MIFEEPLGVNPLHYFAYEVECLRLQRSQKQICGERPWLLPDTTTISGEESFARLFAGWNSDGMAFGVDVACTAEKSYYPDVARGDSVELFLDTRDLKHSGYNTRHCHHFFFLPLPTEGRDRGELTRFRTEDQHELADPKLIELDVELRPKGYSMNIFLPSAVLHGYDGGQFGRLGFSYRINRQVGKAQHFSAMGSDFPIEQQPALWSTLKLV